MPCRRSTANSDPIARVRASQRKLAYTFRTTSLRTGCDDPHNSTVLFCRSLRPNAGEVSGAHVPKRPVIVLVEDHRDTRELYADSLTHAGFNVLTAADAEDGFKIATTARPAVVVTDYRLPGASGAELCSRLRHDNRTANVPTLLVTASSQRANVEAALSEGCAIVRLKPYLPDALERDVRAIMAGKSLPRWPSEHVDSLP